MFQKGFLHCSRVPKLLREVISCGYFIVDMAINRSNQAASEETREGLRIKCLTLCGLQSTLSGHNLLGHVLLPVVVVCVHLYSGRSLHQNHIYNPPNLGFDFCCFFFLWGDHSIDLKVCFYSVIHFCMSKCVTLKTLLNSTIC